MAEKDEDMIANPDRITVDNEEQLRSGERDDSTENPPTPHNQPWPDVAREVKEAVEEADGPV